MIKCFSFFLIPSRSSNMPLYPQSVANQGTCPNFLLFRYFHLRFTFEFIEEVGGASLGVVICSSHKGTKENGYLNLQWHDHIDIVTNGQP
jgi:hypothetical protein